ncbi:hypothetical protein [Halorubrum lipolyticum]|uniref:Glycosyltransferase RgtA/B/C/D-like domain-containing protein n=1 Tax=Halorubrum lipolyticum DSM 21995 TaxID=1227482 RepID=M0NN38_9EURY|nr:hypothetical protein [Halorubrum lipolyticum]EMA59367.1 hypothetical protein C469_12081 [Halorubrum lipolyticum DSM 21995]
MYDDTGTTWTKWLAAAGTACLLGAVWFLLRVPPAAGYEISIYRAYPTLFWVLLIASMFVGQFVVLLAGTADGRGAADLLPGAALVVVPGFVLVLLPYVRGYPVYGRADVLTHIGLLRDLPELGIELNIYPPTHILTQALSAATGLPELGTINLLPAVFLAVYLGSMALLVDHLFDDARRRAFSLPLVLIPIGGSAHVTAVPFILSVLLAPFLLYLLVKEQRSHAVPVRALVLIAVAGVVVYHPLTAVFALVALATYSAFNRIPVVRAQWSGLPNVTSLATVLFVAWYLKYTGIIVRFRNVVDDFLGPAGGPSPLQSTTETVERTSPDPIDLITVAFIERGTDLLVFGFASAFFVLAVALWYFRDERPAVFTFAYGSTTFLFGLMATLFLTNDLIAGFGRPLLFGKLFAAAFVGALFHLVWQRADSVEVRTVVSVAFAGLLLVTIVLSVFGMFTSPIVFDKNHQVTEMELDGTEWLFENRDPDHFIDEQGIYQYRFYHRYYGTNQPDETIRWEGTSPPDHYNYTVNERLGQSYDDDRYLLLPRAGRITYPERFPDYREQWRFVPEDFERLEADRSVDRVYDNGEVNLYLVESEPAPAGTDGETADSTPGETDDGTTDSASGDLAPGLADQIRSERAVISR